MTAPQEKSTPTLASNSDMSVSSFKTSAKKVTISREEFNEAIEETAIALASALKDVEVRRLVKAEVEKKFDGDFDVLFSAISDRLLSGGKTFSQELGKGRAEQQRRSGKSLTDGAGEVEVRTRINKVPLFQIGVPYYVAEKWDAETQTPLVVCLPDGVDDGSMLKQVKAYDSEGNVKFLDVKEYRKNPYPIVVLGMNERTDFKTGKVRPNITLTDSIKSKTVLPDFKTPTLSSENRLSNASSTLVIKSMTVYQGAYLVEASQIGDIFSADDFAVVLYDPAGNEIRTTINDLGYFVATFIIRGISPVTLPNLSIPVYTSSQPYVSVNLDFIEEDVAYFLWWRTAFDDLVEHRWYIDSSRSGYKWDFVFFNFSPNEFQWYGRDRHIDFIARWE